MEHGNWYKKQPEKPGVRKGISGKMGKLDAKS
jgi:hypothetical protein